MQAMEISIATSWITIFIPFFFSHVNHVEGLKKMQRVIQLEKYASADIVFVVLYVVG
ncbi:hypothetical protein I3842_02G071200 [Carya illinoinensis]|uniref:Uncharacterized protein n=1 Tax=Carya illinoinensis TaxID=32201 RepID=A0A922FPU3_CARIL|nr:hypothetical protein I3842_02G071200 [Carya illinoinensis]